MRIVFVGASKLAVATTKNLLQHSHEVVIIEMDEGVIQKLSDEIDCGFLHGDGSKPAILKEAGYEHTDFLFCMTGSDQMNIIASLVGRSLGFSKVITKIEDPELDHICTELGLENIIIPTRTISRYLTDIVLGRDVQDISSVIKADARFFSFIVDDNEEGEEIQGLKVAGPAKVICYYRHGKFQVAEDSSKLEKGDEVVIITHSNNLDELKKRWSSKKDEDRQKGEETSLKGTENIK